MDPIVIAFGFGVGILIGPGTVELGASKWLAAGSVPVAVGTLAWPLARGRRMSPTDVEVVPA